MAWHYIEKGKIVGPFSQEDFTQLRAGLDPSTLVWCDGMKDWQRLESVPLEHRAGPRRKRHLTPAPLPKAGASVEDLAGFGFRLGALLVDKALFILPMGYFWGSSSVVQAWGWNYSWNSSYDWHDLLQASTSGLALALAEFAYEAVMTAEFESTLGKMVFGLKVRHDGQRLNYGRSVARVLAKKLSGYICGIGYLMVLWDKERRGLHDHICATRVYKN